VLSAGGHDAAAAADDDDDNEYDNDYGDTDDVDDYNPYLTIRRNMQHADIDYSAVAWFHGVCTL